MAVSTLPCYNLALFKDAVELFKQSKFDEAAALTLGLISRAKEDNDPSVLSLLYDFYGQCFKAKGEITSALKFYKLAIATDKSCSSAWHNMGLLYLEMAKATPAFDDIDCLASMHTAYLYFYRAIFIAENSGEITNHYFFLHSMACFHEQYAKALNQLDPTQISKIDMYYKNGIQCYKMAIEKCPADSPENSIFKINLSECLAQYGHIFYKSNNFKRAEELYKDALKHNPNHIAANNQLGMIAFKQQNYPQAILFFKTILNIEKEPQEISDAWLNIACSYRKMQQFDEAKKALANAKNWANDPNDEWITSEGQLLDEAISENQSSFVLS